MAANPKTWLRTRYFLVAALCATVAFLAIASVLILTGSRTDAGVVVEHRGTTIVVHGHGHGGNMGYLAAGRYRVTVEGGGDGGGGCSIGFRLTGADGVEWLRMIFYTNRDAMTTLTKELPGQIYNISTDVYLATDSGLLRLQRTAPGDTISRLCSRITPRSESI